jgi:hypothetical protein
VEQSNPRKQKQLRKVEVRIGLVAERVLDISSYSTFFQKMLLTAPSRI